MTHIETTTQTLGAAVAASGYELRSTDFGEDRGEGIFTTRGYRRGETVMVGRFEAEVVQNGSHTSQIGLNRFALHGGLISKVNHSCDPNCGIRVNATGAHDYVARHDIPPDVELTFDYAMRNYTVDHFPVVCGCGMDLCRGSITGWKDLPVERKRAYQGLVADYLLEIDDKLVES